MSGRWELIPTGPVQLTLDTTLPVRRNAVAFRWADDVQTRLVRSFLEARTYSVAHALLIVDWLHDPSGQYAGRYTTRPTAQNRSRCANRRIPFPSGEGCNSTLRSTPEFRLRSRQFRDSHAMPGIAPLGGCPDLAIQEDRRDTKLSESSLALMSKLGRFGGVVTTSCRW